MRITEAARSLGTSARMLRYREMLGLLPPTKEGRGHRHFADAELRAITLVLALEKRYDISPTALAFGLRVLSDPEVHAAVRQLGERLGRLAPPPARALDFEKEKALRLLEVRAARAREARPVSRAASRSTSRAGRAGRAGRAAPR